MVITLYNAKGGVGKTTNTIHIGAALAKLGNRVLLIDFDPQCNTTSGCRISNPKYTVTDFLNNTGKFNVRMRSENYSVLAGDKELWAGDHKPNQLAKQLEVLKAHFDYILIDCPPYMLNKKSTTLPEMALLASDHFIIPLEAETFAVENSSLVLDKVVELIKPKNKKLKFAGFLFSRMLATATARNKKHVDYLNAKTKDSVLKYWIRTDREVKVAVDKGVTIFQHKPNCNAAHDFINVTNELLERIS